MTHPLPNPEEEAERMLLLPAGDWYGKRAHGPEWSKDFLKAAIAAGSIVAPADDQADTGAWLRVGGAIFFVCACIAAATYNLWMPR